MNMKPSHPDEPVLHRQLRDALNEHLTSTEFFVWITVHPTGEAKEFATLPGIAAETDKWLATLDPDDIAPGDLPEKQFEDPAADVTIRAVPKKREARAYRSVQIVGNPEPMLVGWVDG